MANNNNQKPKNVDYFQVSKPLKHIKKAFPKPPKKRRKGRPCANNRAILNGIWYVL